MIQVARSHADLHVHSKYSDRPSEWFLRRIGAPECFVEPADLYRTCRDRGMDFVTITDHNCIRGALEIADRPGAFVSCEFTTYFPEDGCKIHCLAWGLDEAAFAELQSARENIYDLQRCLRARGIAHAVAHPLFRINDRLTIGHVEKLILLFDTFEAVNGARDPRAGALAQAVFEHLTPDVVAGLADRHGLAPAGAESWRKRLTGGSDDHSGLYAAESFTATPTAATTGAFLAHLREGRHEAGGRAGSSVRLARSLIHVAYSYYRSRFAVAGDRSLIGEMLGRLARGADPAPAQGGAVRRALAKPIARWMHRLRRRRLSGIERLIVDEFAEFAERRGADPVDATPDDRNFRMTARIAQHLGFAFLQRFAAQVRGGCLLDSLQSLASLAPVGLGLAPYLTAFAAQHKDERFLQSVAAHFPGAGSHLRRSHRKVWITDTFGDVNGVARTIQTLAPMAAASGRDLTVLTCLARPPAVAYPLKNFEPVGTFALPEYPQQELTFPPFLEILAWIEEERFDEVIVSTPGPLGLCAKLAAKLLGLHTTGIYHTDFPNYVRLWTEDDVMHDLAWKYMRWFYGDMERVFAPSRCYVDQLAQHGLDPAKLAVMPRGIDLDRFNPGRRNTDFWRRHGRRRAFRFLYVGRVAREKNLALLLEAFEVYARCDPGVELAIVGDGPELEALRARFGWHPGIYFAGLLEGEELSAAYASAEMFVFPSLTDTFGNVVLEAHASGLPAIVGDRGGPAEIVGHRDSGLVVRGESLDAWVEAFRRIRGSGDLHRSLAGRALETARESRWERVLEMI